MINYRENSKLNNLIAIIIHAFSLLLSLFIKKRENIWAFGEKQGTLFSGNAKYLYLYVLKNHKNIRAIWFTNKLEIQKEVKKINGECYISNTFKAFYFGLIAKVYIFTVSLSDIGNFIIKNALLINLWHGMPLKNLNTSSSIQDDQNSSVKLFYRRFVANLKGNRNINYDMMISTSNNTKATIEQCFPENSVNITGEPKNDIFFQEIDRDEILKKYNLDKFTNKKIITYLPTHRLNSEYKALFLDFPEIEKIDGIIILEKSHANDVKDAFHQISKKNVFNISSLLIDTQELLYITDILITDYSSCYIDFLLTERPIIFYAYDLDKYQNEIGFYYNYTDVTPGIIVQDEEELIKAIRVYKGNNSIGSVDRKREKNLFHEFQDGNNAERVFEKIKELKKEKDERTK